MIVRILGFVAVALAPALAAAHPGHGMEGAHGLFHHLTDPSHLGIGVLAGAALLLLVALRAHDAARAGRG